MRMLPTCFRGRLAGLAAAGLLLLIVTATALGPARASERVCLGPRCEFPTLKAALAAAPAGAVITMKPGVYEEAVVIDRNGLTIEAAGAHLKGRAAEGKAALVVKASGITIEGLECSGVRVADGNGACVRLENGELTLRNVHFHGNEMGILGGGTLVIEDSVIENNGRAGGSLGHNVYALSGELTIRRSRILSSLNEGHEVKSRAAKTVIEESVIASLDAEDSRLIDVPNGGLLIVRNSVLGEGPASVNWDVIGFGLERKGGARGDHTRNEVIIENNLFVIDRPRGAELFHLKDATTTVIRNNVIVGGKRYDEGDNTWYRKRSRAGLGRYPELPAPGTYKPPR